MNRSSALTLIASLLAALLLGTLPVPAAHAATFLVTKTADTADGTCDADCSLREATTAANAAPGADIITVPAGTYILTIVSTWEDANADGDLDITSDITINGAGASTTIIDGNGGVTLDRVFQITGAFTVNLSGVTVRNGNSDPAAGGGIYVANGATLTIGNSAITNNTTGGTGGGIRTGTTTLTINNSTITGNTASSGSGGGIDINSGTLTITSSTFSDNSASGGGGGIASDMSSGGTVTITNSTFSDNATGGIGGGILTNAGTATITNSTFSGNNAAVSGGGIYNNGGTVLTLRNTIVANSAGGNCGGTITNGGNNIDSVATCAWASTNGSMSNTPPLLGALANNGGPTQTFALLAGSPAIDGVTFSSPNGAPSTDQRGVARPQGVRYDIGAFEAPTCTPPPSGMVSWWPGDGNANDIQGSNNGTLMGGATFAAGKVGQAFSLDGTDDYVVIPNGIIPSTARNFTMDAWVYPSVADNNDRMIIYGGSTAGEYEFLMNNTNNYGFGVKLSDGNWYKVTSPATPNVWAYVVGERRGTSIELWVDGVLKSSTAVPDLDLNATGNNMNNSRLGAYNEWTTEHKSFWKGLIDEVEIFNRALTADEIVAIYNAGSAGKCLPTPTLVKPKNRALVTTMRPTLDWTDSAGATFFEVELRKAKITGPQVTISNPTVSQVKTPRLKGGGTKYYWRVRACNGGGCSAWTAWRWFKVK